MAKINILDSSVYNRIAAGEVVERPASIAKEFIENSLDAGAKNISISIERGGKDRVCVSDDGAGIEKSELKSAFLPHATSKISRAEDLERIYTLGFRGEALASIGSVSNLQIRSKASGCNEAYMCSCIGGVVGSVEPCALGEGTEVSAENLFYNTPVRERFLKSDKSEEGEITNLVSRFILGNPNVSFRYVVDGKQVMQSYGGGLDEAMTAVYGGSVVSQAYKIDATKHGIRIYGYLGKPSFAKANRTYQNVFVNSRYVINNTISSAIMNAYGSYLMKRQYPFYVLFVDVPVEVVDVNVHPNKADVRFENNQVIYGSIYSVVSSVLDGNASALEFVVGQNLESEKPHESNKEAGDARGKDEMLDGSELNSSVPSKETKTVKKTSIFDDLRSNMPNINVSSLYNKKHDSAIVFQDSASVSAQISANREALYGEAKSSNEGQDVFFENKQFLENLEKKAKQQEFIFESAVYQGCLFNTYLLYEVGRDVYIIDQHAAHERLLFDKLKEEMDNRNVVRQPMLVPYVLNLNHEEFVFLSDCKNAIEEIGFEMEEFGENTFKISSVPVDLQNIDIGAFFNEILSGVGSLKGIKLTEILRDKIAMTACKHAVKGGMDLTDTEKEKLFALLHGNMGLKCPHGRPVAVKLSKTDIEKMFKRIV